MSPSLRMFAGIALALAVIWVGCWLDHVIPKGDWRNAPLFFTGIAVGMVAIVLFVYGLVDSDE